MPYRSVAENWGGVSGEDRCKRPSPESLPPGEGRRGARASSITRKGGRGITRPRSSAPRPRPWLGTPPLTPLMGLAWGNRRFPIRTRHRRGPRMQGAFGLPESPLPMWSPRC